MTKLLSLTTLKCKLSKKAFNPLEFIRLFFVDLACFVRLWAVRLLFVFVMIAGTAVAVVYISFIHEVNALESEINSLHDENIELYYMLEVCQDEIN